MAKVKIGSTQAMSLVLEFPTMGAWSARLQVASGSKALSGTVVLEADDLELPGSVIYSRPGSPASRSEVLVVGGAGRLGTTSKAQSYRRSTVRLVVADLLRQAGEDLAPESSSDALDHPLTDWATLRGPVGRGLLSVVSQAGAVWWVNDAGKIQIGQRSTADTRGRLTKTGGGSWGIEGQPGPLGWLIRPGELVEGIRAGRVSYTVADGKDRVRIEAATWTG